MATEGLRTTGAKAWQIVDR